MLKPWAHTHTSNPTSTLYYSLWPLLALIYRFLLPSDKESGPPSLGHIHCLTLPPVQPSAHPWPHQPPPHLAAAPLRASQILVLVLSLEPDFSYLEALAPYQPLAMKCIYCPIDTRLNFIQVSKLLKEVQVRKGSAVSPQPCHCWGVRGLWAEGRLHFSPLLLPVCPQHADSCALVTLHSTELDTWKVLSVLKNSKVEGKESINILLFLMRTICVWLKANFPLSHQKSYSGKLLIEPKDSLAETWAGPWATCRWAAHTELLCLFFFFF